MSPSPPGILVTRLNHIWETRNILKLIDLGLWGWIINIFLSRPGDTKLILYLWCWVLRQCDDISVMLIQADLYLSVYFVSAWSGLSSLPIIRRPHLPPPTSPSLSLSLSQYWENRTGTVLLVNTKYWYFFPPPPPPEQWPGSIVCSNSLPAPLILYFSCTPAPCGVINPVTQISLEYHSANSGDLPALPTVNQLLKLINLL